MHFSSSKQKPRVLVSPTEMKFLHRQNTKNDVNFQGFIIKKWDFPRKVVKSSPDFLNKVNGRFLLEESSDSLSGNSLESRVAP